MKRDIWRPKFHAAPEQGWMNDPSGFCYWDGKYHLFFQYNPKAPVWGNIHWGHLVSRNLLTGGSFLRRWRRGKTMTAGAYFQGRRWLKMTNCFYFIPALRREAVKPRI